MPAWRAARIIKTRLRLVKKWAKNLRATSDAWTAAAPTHVAAVLRAAGEGGLHVALLDHLCQHLGLDRSVVVALLDGFPLVGDIPVSKSAPLALVRKQAISFINADNGAQDLATRSLAKQSAAPRDPEGQKEIASQTRSEQLLGRISASRAPRVGGRRISAPTRRFTVKQLTSKGKLKARIIDDMAESMVNGLCTVKRRIRMGRLSDALKAGRTIAGRTGRKVTLVKTDFVGAYRVCPVLTAHLPFADILFWDNERGGVSEATQHAMPFGAVAAVYAWDRLAEVLTAIVTWVTLLPCNRYVDDIFACTLAAIAQLQRRTALELVKLLGLRLDPEKTPPPSPNMEILGVLVRLVPATPTNPFAAFLSIGESKKVHWVSILRSLTDRKTAGLVEGMQVCGRLAFACYAVFGPIARANLQGLYRWIARGAGTIGTRALDDLHWWSHWLPKGREALVVPRPLDLPGLIAYSDAEGNGGIGGVLVFAQTAFYFGGRVPQKLAARLETRTTQITAFEILAAYAVLLRWSPQMAGHRVVFFIDNIAARGALHAGKSSREDLSRLCNGFWRIIDAHRIAPTFIWVPSAFNASDPPSRGAVAPFGIRVDMRIDWWTAYAALERRSL